MNQQTLRESFSVKGKGLHTGIEITAVFNPAPENHGYKFRRTDLPGQPTVDAPPEKTGGKPRGGGGGEKAGY